ncbi:MULTISPECIES: squalene synthase HpnC [Vitreoscilla]|uniref:Squalene synthase HpnC n=1 Tax=Vitreoscilla stercoraria TaxID=61 RepID=A0ABY4EB69_VITST|nr:MULTISPECIES: squalene synthase HpnC [Vitreoscilla]AUZ05590.1 squalene synthase HpnC [Vitreoscilla sp. C1]UOO92992.1 squalene synthase HpnC [Vitreoscilla stercoraria]
MAVDHYENFPVGSILVPKHLRRPIHAIYAFSRVADDYADEGDDSDEVRLANLQALSDELLLIEQGKRPVSALMQRLLDEAIAPHQLPTALFEDLLDAFRQDVVKKRYQEFDELVDYSRRSANPIGRLLLCLYGVNDEQSLQQSDAICTALQLINFWQDVAIDWQKNRVYLPQTSLQQFHVSESDIAQHKLTPAFQNMMAAQCQRAFQMLQDGSPLIGKLPSRLRWELSMIVLGGERIVRKLMAVEYDVFTQRPVLTKRDWLWMLKQLLTGHIAMPIR